MLLFFEKFFDFDAVFLRMLLFFEKFFDFDAVFCGCYSLWNSFLILMWFFVNVLVFAKFSVLRK
jgi:hypothetical protein